jgi:glycosyltransferase involved in cell wall biosynthesis
MPQTAQRQVELRTGILAMKISVITPTRNSAATIRDTLGSILAQKHPEIEHLVIDGQSTDGTVDIVRRHSPFTHCVSEPDTGMYDAINKGIRLARGEVVGVLNADDSYYDESALARVADVFQREQCDAVYGDLIYADARDPTIVRRYWRAGAYKPGAFKWGWMPPHPTFFLKRSLYEKHGVYHLEFKMAADYELMLRYIHKHRIAPAYIPAVLVKMRTGGVSNRSWANRLQANADDRKAWTLNGLRPYWFTCSLKPMRKLAQFIR